jgi:OOP family OmpA-OmpF porin
MCRWFFGQGFYARELALQYRSEVTIRENLEPRMPATQTDREAKMKLRTTLRLVTTLAMVPSAALAQDKGAGFGVSANAAADSEEGTTADATSDTSADGSTAGSEEASDGKPYMQRYLPQAGDMEIGIFTGLLSLSPSHSLKSPHIPQQPYATPAFEAGARFGYYPLSWFGLEAEFMGAHAKFAEDLSSRGSDLTSNMGSVFAYRGHFVGQIPLWSVVPFALVGGGLLGGTSQPQGHHTGGVFYVGGGVKIPFSENLALRAEFRENFHNSSGEDFGGIAGSEEGLLGLAFKWGRSKPAPQPTPEPDQDRDGVPDSVDKCPEVGALTEDGCPPDTDGDGMADPDDFCPREAGTTESGCPDRDKDQDGVVVPCDLCPDEKGDAPTGCINRDPDGDGISGDDDKCPNEPETKNGYEDADGCPDEVPKEVEKFTGSIDGIWFDLGKATIKEGSRRALQAAADVLKKYPSVHLRVTGHTSSEGDADFNQTLSEERAQAVVQWLVDAGVPSENLDSRGAGSTEPLADNKTQAGRAKNRRIEFNIIQK